MNEPNPATLPIAPALADLAFASASDSQVSRSLAWSSPGDLGIDLNDPEQCRFGDYELLELIGQGGMGAVYRARQHNLDREVALKFLAAGPWASDEFIARFRREAQAAARMQHPNIVEIYDTGVRDGLYFFSMRLVKGETLSDRLRTKGPMPVKQAAAMMRTIAEAIDYAHRLGVLHLDLKPGNVLLGEHDEPLVADFGLARRIDEGPHADHENVSGTPSYMAPEQATAKSTVIGPAADIYGLGAILYEMLVGEPPFRGSDVKDTLQHVLHDDPVAPKSKRHDIPADLDAICLKCLAKDPAQRYASARELANDLGRFLEGFGVQARRLNPLQRTVRWARREPRMALLSAALVTAVLACVGILALALNTLMYVNVDLLANLASNNAGKAFLSQEGVDYPAKSAEWVAEVDSDVMPDTPLHFLFRRELAHQAEQSLDREVAEVLALGTLNGAPARKRLAEHLLQDGQYVDALLALLTFRTPPAERLRTTMDEALAQAGDVERVQVFAAACTLIDSASCDAQVLSAIATSERADNAALWVAVASLPDTDPASERALLIRASDSSAWVNMSDLHWRRMNLAYADAAFDVSPEVDKLRGLARADSIRAQLAFTGDWSLRWPSYRAINRCMQPAQATQDAELWTACDRITTLMEASTSAGARVRGANLRFERSSDPAERDALRVWRKRHFWQAEFASPRGLIVHSYGEPRRFLEDQASLGEMEALMTVLDRHQVPREPHPDWIPRESRWLLFPSERAPTEGQGP